MKAYEKNTCKAALRTCCAERKGAMLRSGMCAYVQVRTDTCTVSFMGICVWKDMEVQVGKQDKGI